MLSSIFRASTDEQHSSQSNLDSIVTLLSRSRLNQRHLLTLDPPRSTTESSLRAIATVDTPATDPAVSSGATCDKCQWR
jgi:hypothetical protein